MSTEQTSSAATQGGQIQTRLETRGENDFSKQLETQQTRPETGGQQQQPSQVAPGVADTSADTGQAVSSTAASPAAKPGLDSAAIEAVVAATLAGAQKGQQQPQQQQQRELSTEEFNKKYSIPSVNVDMMKAIMDADPAKGAQALQNLLIQAVRSGALISKDVLGADISGLRNEFSPHIESWKTEQSRQQTAAMYDKFFTINPDLKDERELVDALGSEFASRVKAGSIKLSSPEEGMKLVADAVRKTITRLRGTAGTAPAKGGNNLPPQREMSAASSAGRSGTGQPQQKSDVETVFGDSAR